MTTNAQPGDPNDRLYIITGGKFYRLQPVEVKAHQIHDTGNDKELFKTLTDLKEKQVVVADLPGPGAGKQASCICIALNLDIFDASITAKIAQTVSGK